MARAGEEGSCLVGIDVDGDLDRRIRAERSQKCHRFRTCSPQSHSLTLRTVVSHSSSPFCHVLSDKNSELLCFRSNVLNCLGNGLFGVADANRWTSFEHQILVVVAGPGSKDVETRATE